MTHSITLRVFVTLFFVFCALIQNSNAQQRDAGQMVVPIGHENIDSVRFHLFNLGGVKSQLYDPAPGAPYADSIADEFQVNFEGSWGGLDPQAIGGKRKGTMARGHNEGFHHPAFNHGIDLGFLTRRIKQRLYFPSPDKPIPYRFSKGFFWRYNDYNIPGSGATWHNNTYDENDINPYCQYPRNTTFVNDTFNSFRDSSWKNYKYGEEGRVILGWSEQREANEMMHVIRNMFTASAETPGLFSTHLDFNIDVDTIDQSNIGARSVDDLPLLRVQVLFKKGFTSLVDPGWSPLPMVPFRTPSKPNNPGWWILADQIVTKRMYDTLPESWRAKDVKESGDTAQSWKFRQLYLRLDSISPVLNSRIYADNLPNAVGTWGNGAVNHSPITTFTHPDMLGEAVDSANTDKWFIEIRVLSMYRSTVRVRSLAYQDTIVDKYMYRQRFGTAPNDTTHSCDPLAAGVFKAQQAGGLDDSVAAVVQRLRNSTGGQVREILVNDTDPWEAGAHDGLLTPFLGVLDHLGSKKNIHVHYREQDIDGSITLHYRRARMSLDGKVPSMYETQYSTYYGEAPWYHYVRNDSLKLVNCWGCSLRDNFPSIIPNDYAAYADRPSASLAWPSSGDTMFNTVWGRLTTGADSLRSYHAYTDQRAGNDFLAGALRGAARHALRHPKSKRFALETAVQGWWQWRSKAWYDTTLTKWIFSSWRPYFTFRPTTPEETSSHVWMALANGFSSFNIAEPFGLAKVTGAAAGPWGVTPRTHHSQMWHLDNSRNWGHIYALNNSMPITDSTGQCYDTLVFNGTDWVVECKKRLTWVGYHGDTSDVNGDLPNWYQGFSNTYRAYKRVLGRLNSAYDSVNSDFAINELEWQDAYSMHRVGRRKYSDEYADDSISHHSAFLKVMKTVPVNRWSRGPRGEYIDLTDADSAHRTYVEVGLFRDRLNGTLTPKGYAALIVNTRLWPTLNDDSDRVYYNRGLTKTIDSSRSTHGDIDVRKVYLQIDRSKMHNDMKGNYYVVRDIWHPDTTWLVHRDSQFAVYLKPGDAKFLYIQKAIAIYASPDSYADAESFGYNNGRRVAERMGGTRQAVVYTRNRELFVSYPGEGRTFEGYHEKSDADAVASGWEEPINDFMFCASPTISVASNDTSVAVVYATHLSGETEIAFAYQTAPGEPWQHTITDWNMGGDTNNLWFTTPVLTPINDTTWFIAFRRPSTQGIHAFRVYVDPTGDPRVAADTAMPITTDTTAAYPTVASRPLPSFMRPVRIAWQENGHIYRRSLSWTPGSPLLMDNKFNVSYHLPNECEHRYPSIAMAGHMKTYGDTTKYITEDIVWEAKLKGKRLTSGSRHWIANRSNTGKLGQGGGKWNIYTLFVPDSVGTEDNYFPNVASSPKKEEMFTYSFNDRLRIMWHTIPNKGLEGRHWISGYLVTDGDAPGAWRKTILGETGKYISQSQTTDSVQYWTTDGRVNHSMVWSKLENEGNAIRITRGWANQISTFKNLYPWQAVAIFSPPEYPVTECIDHRVIDVRYRGEVHRVRSPKEDIFSWEHVEPDKYDNIATAWSDDAPATHKSKPFTVKPNDSLWLERHVDTLRLTALQGYLTGGSDHVTLKLELCKVSDSSWVATMDSIRITSSSGIYPGSGLDPDYATLKLPSTLTEQDVFLKITVTRGNEANELERGIAQVFTKEQTVPEIGALKRTEGSKAAAPKTGYLKLSVHPNPFAATTHIEVKTLEGMPTVIELADALGRRLQVLHSGDASVQDLHFVLEASELSAGTYFIRVSSGSEVETRKIAIVK